MSKNVRPDMVFIATTKKKQTNKQKKKKQTNKQKTNKQNKRTKEKRKNGKQTCKCIIS